TVIRNDISRCIHPRQFVAFLGGGGAGKTSLLHALNGFVPATTGTVRYNGVNLYKNLDSFRPVLGYVPHDDIVHTELTVERTLFYGANLRLPKDTRPLELNDRIDELLSAVGLIGRRNTQVRR